MFYTISSVTSFSHVDLISVFLVIKCIFKLQWPNNQLRKSTPVKALNFQWKMSEISKPLAWLRTTMCKSVLFMFEIRTEKKGKKLFWSTLPWPSIRGVGATFFFEHLIDVFCYLLSFCYLLAEWLAVNTHLCPDRTSGPVCSQWSLLWWLLKGEPISWRSRHSVVIRF